MDARLECLHRNAQPLISKTLNIYLVSQSLAHRGLQTDATIFIFFKLGKGRSLNYEYLPILFTNTFILIKKHIF